MVRGIHDANSVSQNMAAAAADEVFTAAESRAIIDAARSGASHHGTAVSHEEVQQAEAYVSSMIERAQTEFQSASQSARGRLERMGASESQLAEFDRETQRGVEQLRTPSGLRDMAREWQREDPQFANGLRQAATSLERAESTVAELRRIRDGQDGLTNARTWFDFNG